MFFSMSFQRPFIYVSFRSEVSTHSFIKKRLLEGQFTAIPKVHDSGVMSAWRISDFEHDLAPGAFGILEPVMLPDALTQQSVGHFLHNMSPHEVMPVDIDAIIAPGAVFDSSGARYGYGGGYYDRFIAEMSPEAVKIALAFDAQVVDKLEIEVHDQRMDYIITESGVIDCASHRIAQ